MNTRQMDWSALELQHASGAYNAKPLALVRGDGVKIWDADGKEYLDCNTGIGVAALGHNHPALTEAIADQARTLMTANSGYFHNDVRAAFLDKLCSVTPGDMNRVFLCNSGSEAIETTLKLAKVLTGRTGVIAAMRGFHGRTMGSLAATWNPKYREPFEPGVPGCNHVPFGDVEALEAAISDETAAMLLEPIQGEGGIYPAPDGYLKAARELCDRHGTLLIFDEIQSGMGRTGEWFAGQHQDGIIPDAMALAKALGAGVPIGAAVFKENLQFEKGQHGSTYGGNPLASRAGLAMIDIMQSDNLLDNINEVGAYFKQGLEMFVESKPEKVREVRGRGLMLAVQLRGKVGPILSALLDHGILAVSSGSTAIRFLPPFIFSQENADQVLNALDEIL
jgi:acetylornithine/LysW-gamma-L-lysine aminotransferase